MDMNLHTSDRDIHDAREAFEVVGGSRQEARVPSAARTIVSTVSGSGWYHDAAIEQASRAAIEARCNPYG